MLAVVAIAFLIVSGCEQDDDNSAVVDPLPDIDLSPGTGPVAPQAWTKEPLTVQLPASNWVVEYEVNGLRRDPGRADNGGLEHVFGELKGDGFDRVWIMNMGEGRRMRGFVDDEGNSYKTWRNGKDLKQPSDETAVVVWTWDGSRIAVAIDGKVWFAAPLTGRPRTLMVGGTQARGRSFDGHWRNLILEFSE